MTGYVVPNNNEQFVAKRCLRAVGRGYNVRVSLQIKSFCSVDCAMEAAGKFHNEDDYCDYQAVQAR
jgi:hypothetical protein